MDTCGDRQSPRPPPFPHDATITHFRFSRGARVPAILAAAVAAPHALHALQTPWSIEGTKDNASMVDRREVYSVVGYTCAPSSGGATFRHTPCATCGWHRPASKRAPRAASARRLQLRSRRVGCRCSVSPWGLVGGLSVSHTVVCSAQANPLPNEPASPWRACTTPHSVPQPLHCRRDLPSV